MPNEDYANQEQKRIKEIVTGQTRVATNHRMSDLENESDERFYDLTVTRQENKFIGNMLKKQDLDAVDRSRLMNSQERNLSYLLLNNTKFGGDSDYMEDVKRKVRWLEITLSKEVSSVSQLSEAQYAYDVAIGACNTYIQNKSPWFPTGKARKKKVKERLGKLMKEKEAFENGRILITQGKVEIKDIKKASDLIIAYRNWESQGNRMTNRTGVKTSVNVDKSEIFSQRQSHAVNTKDSYTMPQMDPDSVNLNEHQIQFKLLSVRGAITDIIGKERYSGFDSAVSLENKEAKQVKIHHALGTKLANQGQEVIEIDCAGSTFKQFRKDHKGFKGKGKQRKGKRFEDAYGTDYMTGEFSQKGILLKSKVLENDKEIPRYNIQGPGLFNATTTDFDIKGIGGYVFDLTSRYIKKFTDSKEWQQNPTVININIQGHSRGGVGETVGIKRLYDWIEKTFPDSSPEKAEFKKYIKVNMIQHDPVAGYDAADKYHTHDLRGKDGKPIEGLNTTTIYSMHTEHEKFFTPANIRGQKRIILMADKHGVGLDAIDTSQKMVDGDKKFHRPVLFDSKTGEAYRGSGLNELPKGVFIRDENGAIVRMRSYAEAERVFSRVIKNTKSQKDRHKVILESVKQWFIDNDYVDETMTQNEACMMGLAIRDRSNPSSAMSVIHNAAFKNDMQLQAVIAMIDEAETKEHLGNNDYNTLLHDLEPVNDAIKQYMEETKLNSEIARKKVSALSEILSLYRAELKFVNENG